MGLISDWPSQEIPHTFNDTKADPRTDAGKTAKWHGVQSKHTIVQSPVESEALMTLSLLFSGRNPAKVVGI